LLVGAFKPITSSLTPDYFNWSKLSVEEMKSRRGVLSIVSPALESL
jgi:hypothetical protein